MRSGTAESAQGGELANYSVRPNGVSIDASRGAPFASGAERIRAFGPSPTRSSLAAGQAPRLSLWATFWAVRTSSVARKHCSCDIAVSVRSTTSATSRVPYTSGWPAQST